MPLDLNTAQVPGSQFQVHGWSLLNLEPYEPHWVSYLGSRRIREVNLSTCAVRNEARILYRPFRAN
ncbi:MAG: hypothetical protein QME81_10110 [bacterium]|nr:hypothetical protein [bacterium]